MVWARDQKTWDIGAHYHARDNGGIEKTGEAEEYVDNGRGTVDRKDSDGVCEGGRGSGEVEKDCAVIKVPQRPAGYGSDLT